MPKLLGTVVQVQDWHMAQEKERRIALQTCEALQQTLQDRPDDLENAHRDGPSVDQISPTPPGTLL
jgi:hypothetical protein